MSPRCCAIGAKASTVFPPHCACRSGCCARRSRGAGKARGPAISRSRAVTSFASTASMPVSTAGAWRIPISPSASSMPAWGARTDALRPAFFISGIPKTTAPSWPTIRRGSMRCCAATGSAHCAACPHWQRKLMRDAIPNVAPFGSRAPNMLDRATLAVTRSMPDNWLGLRLAILFRRIVTSRLGRGALDIELWGMRLRLHALGNGCEKNALFTPQMFDVMERRALAEAIEAKRGETFTFVDIGANVGLYSLFVAARSGGRARILAIEPQPGVLDRLRFNLAANPAVQADVLPIAVADREGAVELILDANDSGGTHI